MIERILDNYFTNKLLEEIKWSFIVRNLDYKFVDEGSCIGIEAKPKKYKDEHYEKIICIDKSEALRYLCDLDKFRKEIVKILNNFSKEKRDL